MVKYTVAAGSAVWCGEVVREQILTERKKP
jgi:hypothetical protein